MKYTKLNKKYKKFKNYIYGNFNKYIIDTINNGINYRSINTSKNQLILLNNINDKYPDLELLSADKNRGNVLYRKTLWILHQLNFLKNNDKNYFSININEKQLIEDKINECIKILFSYKSRFGDLTKCIKLLKGGIYNRIGNFSAIPKVHKKDIYGNFIKKLRPIINMRNTITSISSSIIKEITRKILYYIKRTFSYISDFDDIRDIIIKTINFNKNNIINYNTRNKCISCDINNLYDNIDKDDLLDAINYSINNLLPFNYIDHEIYDLYQKSINHFFNNSFFKFENKYYKQIKSMIQGSISGRDTSNLVLVINEIKYREIFNKYLLFNGRYADDVVMIINENIKIKNKEDIKNILFKLNLKFNFDNYIKDNKLEICDVNIDIINGKLITSSKEDGKVRNYVLKSSNTKQSINSITKCLQERYIIINSRFIDYLNMKKLIFSILLNNEWTGYDLRKVEHLKYQQRMELINKYIIRKEYKYNKYINENKLYILDKNWWTKDLDLKEFEYNYYITYQKTLIHEKKINFILNDSLNYFKDIDDIDIFKMKNNIYFKYQPAIKNYIN